MKKKIRDRKKNTELLKNYWKLSDISFTLFSKYAKTQQIKLLLLNKAEIFIFWGPLIGRFELAHRPSIQLTT